MKTSITKTPDYFILNDVVFRSPAFEYNKNISPQFIKFKLTDKLFLEAIYLASPVLYHQSIKLLNGKIETEKQQFKILASLTRYYIRMCTRATPFGLFAGCGIATWDQQTFSHKQKNIRRHTRMDMYFLCKLTTYLLNIKSIRSSIKFYLNNTGYTVGNEWRYIEYEYVNDVRKYQLSSIELDETLQKVFSSAANGKSLSQLSLIFKKAEIHQTEILQYLDDLVINQVLVSELEPKITGNGYLEQIIKVLLKYNNQNIPEIINVVTVLKKLKKNLAGLDLNSVNNVTAYTDIIELLNSFSIHIQESKLFQVDTFFKQKKTETVSLNIKQQIQESISVMAALTEFKPNSNLQNFIEKYINRYEEKQMPLVQVLDQEYGIGYQKVLEIDNDILISNLDLNNNTTDTLNLQLTPFQLNLLQKTIEVKDKKHQVIDLQTSDFPKQTNFHNSLPPTINISFRILDDKETIKVDGFSAGSAKNLIARFCHGNKSINEIASSISNAENHFHANCILAEIIHLPENRTGNILQHLPFHQYEIPYLAQSIKNKKHQININDIAICIQNNQIILWSVKLNKQIIPKLSNAHNYKIKSLPVYHFLCDLQTQQYNKWYGLNIEFILDVTGFIPTIKYKNIVLYAATWKIKKNEIDTLLNDYSTKKWQYFINHKKLPTHFILADDDNELFVDTNNKWLIQVFLSTVKNKRSFLLKEAFSNNTNEAIAQNEYMAFGLNQQSAPLSISHKVKYDETNIQRTFLPGSNWFYCKIYCGFKKSNAVLNEQITSILNELFKLNVVIKWFFVRYKDPDNHLRIRLLLSDHTKTHNIFKLINNSFNTLIKNGTVTKIKTDTYVRELERYGQDFIEITESIFYAQSKIVLNCLNNELLNSNTSWIIALYLCHCHINAFQLSDPQKIQLLAQICKGFYKEFDIDKVKEQSLNKKYNENRQVIIDILQNNILSGIEVDKSNKLYNCLFSDLHIQYKKITAHCKTSNQATTTIQNLLPSWLHMFINKIMVSQQRPNELVLYHFLHRFYLSKQFFDESNKAKTI